MPKLAMALSLSATHREQLCTWVRVASTPQQAALRCRLVLSVAQGMQDLEIAAEHTVNRHTVSRWRKRVRVESIGCVWEIAPGRGRKPSCHASKHKAIIQPTLQLIGNCFLRVRLH